MNLKVKFKTKKALKTMVEEQPEENFTISTFKGFCPKTYQMSFLRENTEFLPIDVISIEETRTWKATIYENKDGILKIK